MLDQRSSRGVPSRSVVLLGVVGGLLVMTSRGSNVMGRAAAFALLVLCFASIWRVFQHAGEPGWAAFVPIYNLVVLLRIARRPLWWLLLLLVPVVNVFALVAVDVSLAHRFRRSTAFGMGLSVLPFVFFPLLAFRDDMGQFALDSR